MTIHKALANVEIKDATKGTVEAVFSTFGVRDLDGDVVVKGAMTDGAAVVISGYGHTSWDGTLPIGKGTIRTTDTEAILDGQFFLNTTHGNDAFQTIKELGALGQWSYSLEDVVAKNGELDGEPVRFIEQVKIHEVSPVLRGASIATRTLAVKATNKFSENTDAALADVKALAEMAVERLTLRAAEGKSVDEQIEAYDRLIAELVPWKSAIDAATPATPPDHTDELQRIFLSLVATSQGVTT